MADDLDKIPEELLTDEERKKRAKQLTRDIANRYSPERLSRVVVEGAGQGEHLDQDTRSEMESRIGGSFSHVRVFKGPFAETVTRQHKADAVTVGSTGMILMREGPRSNPKTALGRALLAHELTHVAQAQRGLHFALEGGASGEGSHEKAAEKVESEAYAAAKGEGGAHGGGGGGGPDLEKMIIERVFQMMEDETRNWRERLGIE